MSKLIDDLYREEIQKSILNLRALKASALILPEIDRSYLDEMTDKLRDTLRLYEEE